MAMTLSRRTLLVTSAGVTAALFLAAPSEPTEAQGSDVVVFAAASLKNALDAVNAQWTKETGKKAVISYASSSALAKQIEQGAPAQMFISADLDWMDYLAAKSLIKPDTRSNLLGNRIVLIASKDKAQPVEIKPGFDLASVLGDGRLSMANVDAVPAGKYGKAALEKLGRERARRTAAGLARRGAGRDRLSDGRSGRPQRQNHRHVSRGHAPADHLSDRLDGQCNASGRRRIPRLHQIGEGETAVPSAGVHRARPGAVLKPWPTGAAASDREQAEAIRAWSG
jgi:ABC-type molybdate transport system substrate-binding protein